MSTTPIVRCTCTPYNNNSHTEDLLLNHCLFSEIYIDLILNLTKYNKLDHGHVAYIMR